MIMYINLSVNVWYATYCFKSHLIKRSGTIFINSTIMVKILDPALLAAYIAEH